MIDADQTDTADGLKYNEAGYLVAPKPVDYRCGQCSLILAFLFPFFVLWSKWSWLPSAELLKSTRFFQILLRQGLLSDQQVKNAQFLLACLLILIVCSVPPYLKRNIKKYSMQHPPPSALKKLWPPQIRGMIAIGVLLFIAPVIVANFVDWGAPIDILAPKRSMFIALLLLSEGIYFTAEGSACGALYTYFYLKYWRLND